MATAKKVATKLVGKKKEVTPLFRATKTRATRATRTVKSVKTSTAAIKNKTNINTPSPKVPSKKTKITNTKKVLQTPATHKLHSKFKAIEALHLKNKEKIVHSGANREEKQVILRPKLALALLSPYRFPIDVHTFATSTARVAGVFFILLGAIFTMFFASHSFSSPQMLASSFSSTGTTSATLETLATPDVTSSVNCLDPLLYTSPTCSTVVNKKPPTKFEVSGTQEALAGSVRVRVTVPFATRVRLGAYYKTGQTAVVFGPMVNQSSDTWEFYIDTTKFKDGTYVLRTLIENPYGTYETAYPTEIIFVNHPLPAEAEDTSSTTIKTSTEEDVVNSTSTESTTVQVSSVELKSDVTQATAEFHFEVNAPKATGVKIFAVQTQTGTKLFLGNAYLDSEDRWKFLWHSTSFASGGYKVMASAVINGVPTVSNSILVSKTATLSTATTTTVVTATPELQPKVVIALLAKQPVMYGVDIRIDVQAATFVELYLQGKTSLIKKYLGVAKKVDTNTWMYQFDSKQVPNGDYELIAAVKNQYGVYEAKSIVFSIGNPVAVSLTPTQIEAIKVLDAVATEVPKPQSLLQDSTPVTASSTAPGATPLVVRINPQTDIPLELRLQLKEKLDILANATRLNDSRAIVDVKKQLDELKAKIFVTRPGVTPQEVTTAADTYIREAVLKTEEAVQITQKILVERTGEKISLDSDKDGISNYDEVALYKTNPFAPDTDGDGFTDGAEILSGHNPLDSKSEVLVAYESPQETGITRNDLFAVTSITTALQDPQTETEEPEANTTPKPQPVAIISGKALPNSFVTLYIFSTPVVVTLKTEDDGSWSYRFDKELEDGTHKVYVGVTDNAGKIVAKSDAFSFVKEAEAFTGITQTQEAEVTQVEVPKNSFLSQYMVYLVLSISTVAIGLVLILLGLHLDSRKKVLIVGDEEVVV